MYKVQIESLKYVPRYNLSHKSIFQGMYADGIIYIIASSLFYYINSHCYKFATSHLLRSRAGRTGGAFASQIFCRYTNPITIKGGRRWFSPLWTLCTSTFFLHSAGTEIYFVLRSTPYSFCVTRLEGFLLGICPHSLETRKNVFYVVC